MAYRITIVLLFISKLSIAQSSQWSIGPSVSVVRFQTREYEDKAVWGGFPDEPQWGFDAGLAVRRSTGVKGFSVSSGLMYSRRTWEGGMRFFSPVPLSPDQTPDQPPILLQIDYFGKFGFLRIPLLGGYEYQNFTIKAGPSLDILLHGDNDIILDEAQLPEDTKIGYFEFQPRSFLFGLQVKLDYALKISPQHELVIGAKYNPMVTSLYKDIWIGETNFRLVNYGISITFLKTLLVP